MYNCQKTIINCFSNENQTNFHLKIVKKHINNYEKIKIE